MRGGSPTRLPSTTGWTRGACSTRWRVSWGITPEFRLVFAGSRHPNPQVGETRAARDTRTQPDRLVLAGHRVFFLDWVPYDERASYLLEADVVVSTHLDHLEAAFSYRTRILDALWATRPVVATSGDALSDAVATRDAGIVAPPHSVDALAYALAELVEDPVRRATCGAAAGRLGCERRWSLVVRTTWCSSVGPRLPRPTASIH